jgi:hypothetical protein
MSELTEWKDKEAGPKLTHRSRFSSDGRSNDGCMQRQARLQVDPPSPRTFTGQSSYDWMDRYSGFDCTEW